MTPVNAPCPYCNVVPRVEIRTPSKDPRFPDGWSRISCMNEYCDFMPTTGWFRDDVGDTNQARATWELISKRDPKILRNKDGSINWLAEWPNAEDDV